jgi:hypothetical protein
MITWNEISAFVDQGYLTQLQTNYMTQWKAQGAKISDILDTFLSWSQQNGVTFAESRLPDALIPEVIAEGDNGPMVEVPPGYNRDMWYNWVAPWREWVPPLAQNVAAPVFIDPGRELVAPSVVVPYVAPQPAPAPVSVAVAPSPAPVVPVSILSSEPDEPIQSDNKMPSLEYSLRATESAPDSGGAWVQVGTDQNGQPQFSWISDALKGVGNVIKGGLSGLATGGLVGAIGGAVGALGGSKGADTVSIVSDPLPGPVGITGSYGFPGFTTDPSKANTVFTPGNINQALELLGGTIGGPAGALAQGALNLLPGNSPASSSVGNLLPANQPVAQMPASKQINKAQPGYVLVTREWKPGRTDTLSVQEWYARKMGWYKSPAKPPVSVGQWNAIKKASTAKRKIKSVYEKAEALTTCKPTRRKR